MLSSLIRWDHSYSWDVPTAEEFIALGYGAGASMTSSTDGKASGKSFHVDVAKADNRYLAGNIVNGRVAYPVAGYLVLAWRQLAAMSGTTFGEDAVVFDDVVVHRSTTLQAPGSARFVRLFTVVPAVNNHQLRAVHIRIIFIKKNFKLYFLSFVSAF